MIKKGIFYFLTLSLIFIFYISIDVLLSNTILRSTQCYDYKTYEKGYFYFLKKIAKHGNVLKEDFLQQIYIQINLVLELEKKQ